MKGQKKEKRLKTRGRRSGIRKEERGKRKNVELGTQDREFFMQLVQLRCCGSGGGKPDGISAEYPGDPDTVYRSNEPEVYSGRLQAGGGRGLGVRVTSRRLPLPGR